MRIALLGTTVGCVIGFRADLIRDLTAEGHEVYAFALDYDELTRAKVSRIGAFPVQYRFSRSGLNPLSDIVNTWRLAREHKEISPDLVFSYFSKPVIFGTAAAAMAGVKRRIGMLEGLGYLFAANPSGTPTRTKVLRRLQVALYKCIYPLLERLVLLNADDKQDLLRSGLTERKISVLGPIGLDLSKYRYCSPPITPVSFIFIGRLLQEKGILEFLLAAETVKKRFPEARFIVLGGGDPENPGSLSPDVLRSFTTNGTIEYPGQVLDVVSWIQRSSVFVLPSYREGYPRSTQEAMSIGRAVITTDVPGCRNTVIEGVNGFLVPAGSHEALAEKMIYFIRNSSQINAMGLASRRLSEEWFDSNVANRKLISYFDHNEQRCKGSA